MLVTRPSSLITFFMRLDLFLKASRLCPRRTVAQEMCDAGVVEVNGAPSKSSRAVREGDRITLKRRHRITTVRVLYVPKTKQVARHEAAALYEILSDAKIEEDDFNDSIG
jgi:ribosomal 50S subunit-recycling heat shock protein